MHVSHNARASQQHRVRKQASNSDAYAFFNLLTGEQLLGKVESLLPDHRERLFPPTETLSMFMAQALSADRSCQKAVNEIAVKRLAGGLPQCSTHMGAYCRARARCVALAGSSGSSGKRRDGDPAGHAAQSGGLSAIAQPEAGAGLSAVPHRRTRVLG